MDYIDYRELHRDTINKLHQMVNSGKITVETACSICADFVPESIKEDIITYLSTVEDKELIPYESWIAWLEKKGEQKPAWSEEDEMIALSIEQVMNCASLLNIVPEKIDKIRTWLKSLKERYTWKPSELQIEALESATENCAYSEYQDCLRELIGQLKKLREGKL